MMWAGHTPTAHAHTILRSCTIAASGEVRGSAAARKHAAQHMRGTIHSHSAQQSSDMQGRGMCTQHLARLARGLVCPGLLASLRLWRGVQTASMWRCIAHIHQYRYYGSRKHIAVFTCGTVVCRRTPRELEPSARRNFLKRLEGSFCLVTRTFRAAPKRKSRAETIHLRARGLLQEAQQDGLCRIKG